MDYQIKSQHEQQEYLLQIAYALHHGGIVSSDREKYLIDLMAACGLSNEFRRIINLDNSKGSICSG